MGPEHVLHLTADVPLAFIVLLSDDTSLMVLFGKLLEKDTIRHGAHLFKTLNTLLASKCPIIKQKTAKICLTKDGLMGYGTPRTFGPIGLRLLVAMAIGSAPPLVKLTSMF